MSGKVSKDELFPNIVSMFFKFIIFQLEILGKDIKDEQSENITNFNDFTFIPIRNIME